MNARCPHCQMVVVNDASVAGKVVACPKCHNTFQMPSAAVHPMATPVYATSSLLGPGPKNSGLAAVLSFFWTGLGQIYNGQIFLGLMLICAQFVCVLLCFVLIGFPLLAILWIWGIYDAYNTAEAINRGQRTA
jgi:predicted Zn finger-like uncharacterized protein